LLVKEVMVKDVITIDHNKTVLDACDIYKEYKIGCLVVTDKESCIGIVTERDLIERTICLHRDPEKTKVDEIMSSDIKTVHALETLEKTIEIMEENKIKKLPVVQNNEIVGIITVTDISHARPDLSKRFMETWVKSSWKD